ASRGTDTVTNRHRTDRAGLRRLECRPRGPDSKPSLELIWQSARYLEDSPTFVHRRRRSWRWRAPGALATVVYTFRIVWVRRLLARIDAGGGHSGRVDHFRATLGLSA